MNEQFNNTSQRPRQMSREDGELTPEYAMTPQHTMAGNLEDNLAALRMQSAQPDMVSIFAKSLLSVALATASTLLQHLW